MLKVKSMNGKKLLITSLLLSDLVAGTIAFFTAYFLRDKGIFRTYLDSIQPLEIYLQVLPFVLSLLILIMAFNGLYKRRTSKFTEMYLTFQFVSVWILLIMAGSYLSKYDYSRLIVILLYFFTLFFITFGRIIVGNMVKLNPINVLIISYGKIGHEIAKSLREQENVNYNLVGFVDEKRNSLGKLSDVPKLVKKYSIEEVYIASPLLSYSKMLTLVSRCLGTNVRFKVVSDVFQLVTGKVDISDLENIPSLDLDRVRFPVWKRTYKRSVDVFLAMTMLIFSFPIWVVILFVIKLESLGPAILKQERVGLGGRIFQMYKFRTMRKETPLYGKSPKTKDDQRITKIGRFLRRTSLDEIPQLINVIKGDMSLVGPRPEMEYVVRRYRRWEKVRLLVKPGLTGLWQILGRKDLPLSEHLEYDFYYVNNHSFLLDLVILLKTVPQVLQGKGAY